MEVTTLQIYDVVGTWIAAIGTVGAVITSLWLSFNAKREKLKINASSRILVDSTRSDRPMLCMINIVNIGNRQSNINIIGWEIGRGKKKKSFWQNTKGSISDNIPKTLQEGEEATITIDCYGKNAWVTRMAKLTEGYNVKNLKVVVSTAVDSFKVKIDDSLVKEIQKEKKRLVTQEN